MLVALVKKYAARLGVAYGLSGFATIAGQLYPLATGIAINGVLEGNYYAIAWLVGCHFTVLALEVSGKVMDTRVYTGIYADLAGSLVVGSHARGIDPSVIAARSALSREYVDFLERDVPASMSSIAGVGVSLIALIWLDAATAIACALLFVPLVVIGRRLARISKILTKKLNDRLEREVVILRHGRKTTVKRHFSVVGSLRVKLSDAEARSFFSMEMLVICAFVAALVSIGGNGSERAGDIYAVFAYVWKYVLALDNVPQLVQQLAKIRDLNERMAVSQDVRSSDSHTQVLVEEPHG